MISLILFVLAGTFVIWQFGFFFVTAGALASGKVNKAKSPMWPMMVATVLAIAGVVLR